MIFARALFLMAGAMLSAVPLFAQSEGGTPTLWKNAVGGRIVGSPKTQTQVAILLTEDRTVRAYHRDGTLLWKKALGVRFRPFLSVAPDGTSYVPSEDGRLFALNRAGRLLWILRLDGALQAPPMVGFDGRLFVDTDASISCYSAAGRLKWRDPLSAPLIARPTPTPEGGILLPLGTEGEETLRTYSAFGVRTDYPSGTMAVTSAIAISQGDEGQARVAIVASSSAQGLFVLDAQGRKLLATEGKSPISDLVQWRGAVAFVCQDGTVGLIDGTTRALRWRGSAGKSGSWILHADSFGLYALSQGGAAGFAEDGRRLWIMSLSGVAGEPCFSDDGIIYAGGADWILYAYRVEERIKNDDGTLFGTSATPSARQDYGLASPGASSWEGDPFMANETTRDQLLSEIADAIARGEVGSKERDYTAVLQEIGGESSRNPAPAPRVSVGERFISLPQHRARACELLGYLGSSESVSFLVSVFTGDKEAVVRSAAADALGAIGVDPESIAMKAFFQAVSAPAPVRDERLLYSIASSVGALCRFSGPPLSDRGIPILVALRSPDRPSSVRYKAASELERISRD